ncbi:MAG: hypothetical protein LBV68_07695 [Spirochaetaceae bacterium]|nr:hypothetical protein [Spirochaetaceae bacterium]
MVGNRNGDPLQGQAGPLVVDAYCGSGFFGVFCPDVEEACGQEAGLFRASCRLFQTVAHVGRGAGARGSWGALCSCAVMRPCRGLA